MKPVRDWTWHRWQLVHIAPQDNLLAVDLIQLTEDPTTDPGALVTLSFRGVDASGLPGLHSKLASWMDHEDGVCDCFHCAAEPFGCLALFQGHDSLIVSIMDLPA